jgi:rod shape-determining protein MreC
VSLVSPGAFDGLRSEATDVVAPAGDAGAVGRSGIMGILDSIGGYFRAGSQNDVLRQENREARVKLAEAEALAAENDRLKALLGLSEEEIKPVAFGRLIGGTPSSVRRLAYLSVGRDQGVRPGMPVRSPLGLVGRVLEAGDSSARVLLLTDSNSMVPVRRSTDNVVAFAEGRADGTLRIRLINLGINPLKEGDIFVTSGAGGIYRPGIAVATVSEVTRDGAIALLLSNPAATTYVAVDPVWAPEAQEPAPQATEAPAASESQ